MQGGGGAQVPPGAFGRNAAWLEVPAGKCRVPCFAFELVMHTGLTGHTIATPAAFAQYHKRGTRRNGLSSHPKWGYAKGEIIAKPMKNRQTIYQYYDE